MTLTSPVMMVMSCAARLSLIACDSMMSRVMPHSASAVATGCKRIYFKKYDFIEKSVYFTAPKITNKYHLYTQIKCESNIS